ncbi:heterokaryon incompatibility protein-domain-containing protein [Xylaria flabelliformis]|nr:heterokaryon incompatibility protein-domain-containing protein [Xylaria flabelliformis]
MLRWHREDCPGPWLQFREESVECLTCMSNSSYLLDLPRRSRVVPAPSIRRRSCLNLAWPSSVEYSKKCVVKPSGGDFSYALIDYLGNASYNEKPDTQQDMESKLGFPHLPSDYHIRVLHLSPARQWTTPLHGYLEVQDLNRRPYYEALSYTWVDEKGDAALSRTLYIGTECDILPITESCFQALRRLRLEGAYRPIWVDSICINQLNNVEKSHQIALMRTIYAKSIRCVADLGEPTSSSDMVIEYANNPGDNESMDQLSRELVDDALSDLFRRKYFSRIWIIQEIVSAPQVKINCGTGSVDWRLLVASTPMSIPLYWMQGFRDSVATGRPTNAYHGPRGLLQLLRDTADSECSDPRDKIFALLGLVRGLDLEGITADYDLTYVQVYTGLAAYLIRNHGYVKLIMMGTKGDASLPSWVPNWTLLRELDWAYFDARSRAFDSAQQKTLRESACLVLDNSLKSTTFRDSNVSESIRPIIRTTNLINEQLYRPEIHGQTGALIYTVSFLFSFKDPKAKNLSSTRCTKWLWKASERDISQLVIVTLEPVIEDMDIIACFPGQKALIHLRRTLFSTYRILGEAMIFLHELSEERAKSFPPSEEKKRLMDRHIILFTDYITLWCEKVSNASELWKIFNDPTGSSGFHVRFTRDRQTTCIFYSRGVTIEEVHGQYLALKKEFGSMAGVLKHWIGRDGQSPAPSVVGDLIQCIAYWRESENWENSDTLLLPIQRKVVEFHLTAWLNANIIRQRWLAIEKLLAARHEMDKTCGTSLGQHPIVADSSSIANIPAGKIIEVWKDLTRNLVLRLNLLADAADIAAFSLLDEGCMQANEFDRECDEFLNDTFADILHGLDEMYRSCEQHQTARDNGAQAESPGIPDQTMDLLGLLSAEGGFQLFGSHHEDWQENKDHAQCHVCIDLRDRCDTMSWEENWTMPKSRSDIKTAVRALGITTYGDRRRFALWKEPDMEARRAAQVSGGLLDLSLRALEEKDIVII